LHMTTIYLWMTRQIKGLLLMEHSNASAKCKWMQYRKTKMSEKTFMDLLRRLKNKSVVGILVRKIPTSLRDPH
jgi:hypothetical protein